MVALTPRFLLLAALCAAAAAPSTYFSADARAIVVEARHRDAHSVTTTSESTAFDNGKIAQDFNAAPPVIPAPSFSKATSKGSKAETKKHGKDKKKDEKRAPLYADDYRLRYKGSWMNNDDTVQASFEVPKGSHQRRLVSRVYEPELRNELATEVQEIKDAETGPAGNTWDPLDPIIQFGGVNLGDGRHGSYSDTHSLADILRRDPHHHFNHDKIVITGKHDEVHVHDRRHHHHHHDHDKHTKMVVSGNDDRVHVNKRMPLPEPHHHHHHGGHKKIVVSGNNDDIHVHERREPEPHHHHHHDHDYAHTMIISGNNDNVHVHDKRDPEPHHPHYRHGHHEHDKMVVSGDHDNVHVNERRAPEPHHHHHHHDGHWDHAKMVVSGNDDDVHVHERRDRMSEVYDGYENMLNMDLDVNIGDGCERVGDKLVGPGCPDVQPRSTQELGDSSILDIAARLGIHTGPDCEHIGDDLVGHGCIPHDPTVQQRRDVGSTDMSVDTPGVPGSVDIVDISTSTVQKLASLVLSAATTADNGTDTKAVDPSSSTQGPFVLDASNSTRTTFFLVPQTASTEANSTLAGAQQALNETKVAIDTPNTPESSEIEVTLQVPVFEAATASMRQYCATYDPNPPAPAPMTMSRCASGPGTDAETSTVNDSMMNSTDLGMNAHRSQTFLYNTKSGTVRPQWESDDAEPTASDDGAAGNAGGMDGKQMDFSVGESVKDDGALPVAAPLSSLPVSPPSAPVSNLPSAPVSPPSAPVSLPSAPVSPPVSPPVNPTSGNSTTTPMTGGSSMASPQNVTLVFTPAAPAVQAVQADTATEADADTDSSMDSEDTSATEDSDDDDQSASTTDSGDDDDDTSSTDSTTMTMTMVVPSDSDESATTPTTPTPTTSSDDGSTFSTDSSEQSATPTTTPDADSDTDTAAEVSAYSAAIEKMYGTAVSQ